MLANLNQNHHHHHHHHLHLHSLQADRNLAPVKKDGCALWTVAVPSVESFVRNTNAGMRRCVQELTPHGKKLKKKKICKPPNMVAGLGLGNSGSGSGSGSGSHSNGGQVADEGGAGKYGCSAFLQTLQASHNSHSKCISQINVIASFLKLKKKDSDE